MLSVVLRLGSQTRAHHVSLFVRSLIAHDSLAVVKVKYPDKHASRLDTRRISSQSRAVGSILSEANGTEEGKGRSNAEDRIAENDKPSEWLSRRLSKKRSEAEQEVEQAIE